MTFDLNLLKPVKADEGAILELVNPESEEVIPGLTITLLGQDSKVYRKIKLARQQALLNRIAKGKKVADLDAEKMDEDSIEDLVKLTVSWTGVTVDGVVLECTPENVKRVYSEWEWIKEQVQEFAANRANFFRAND